MTDGNPEGEPCVYCGAHEKGATHRYGKKAGQEVETLSDGAGIQFPWLGCTGVSVQLQEGRGRQIDQKMPETLGPEVSECRNLNSE